MADENTQPDQVEQPAGLEPDRHIVSAFHMQVMETPGGTPMLAVHHFNRNELLLLDLSDTEAAERLADEIRPSRIAVPTGNGKLVIP